MAWRWDIAGQNPVVASSLAVLLIAFVALAIATMRIAAEQGQTSHGPGIARGEMLKLAVRGAI